MNPQQQFISLGRKQLQIQEALEMLHQTKAELRATRSSADRWALLAAVSNAVLVPLNCIVNAYQLGPAKSLYERLVRHLYDKITLPFGSASEISADVMIMGIKAAAEEVLKKKGKTMYVPSLNILVGLTEDAVALYEVLDEIQQGSAEMSKLAADIERRIQEATKHLERLGIERAEALGQAQRWGRTA